MKIMLIIAALGCILCGWCDIIITYTPNGRFKLDDLKDNGPGLFPEAEIPGGCLFGIIKGPVQVAVKLVGDPHTDDGFDKIEAVKGLSRKQF